MKTWWTLFSGTRGRMINTFLNPNAKTDAGTRFRMEFHAKKGVFLLFLRLEMAQHPSADLKQLVLGEDSYGM